MSTSTASATTDMSVREWVESRKPGTFFNLDAVPGTPRMRQTTLSRMVNEPNARLQRVARGIYQWARRRDLDGNWAPTKRPDIIVMLHAGRIVGSGWCGVSAKYKLGWVHQVPVYGNVAVLRDRNGNIPKSPLPYVTYHSRSNQRRAELSWAEVTVLEGLRSYTILGDYDCVDRFEWELAMEKFTRGRWWDDYASQIRLDAIRWAMDTEPSKHLEDLHRGYPALAATVNRKRAADLVAENASRDRDASQRVP